MNKKFAYLVPNLFTASSLVFALIALKLIAEDSFVQAAWMVTLSILFDGLDGRMARILNAMSQLGAEADSLADFVAFGVVPGFLAWKSSLHYFGLLGFIVFIFYVLCAGFRLARFNVMLTNLNKKENFTGLPVPAAAAAIASFILFNELVINDFNGNIVLLLVLFSMGFLMISTIPYLAVVKASNKKKQKSMMIILITIIILLAVKHAVWVFFIGSYVYIIFGLLKQTVLLNKKIQKIKKAKRVG